MASKQALRRGNRAYRNVFKNSDPDARTVLADLSTFCFAQKTHEGNTRMEGRREVWLRINTFLNVTDSELRDMVVETVEQGERDAR